jgi:uncharacterized protein YjiS (DUF1127 family)
MAHADTIMEVPFTPIPRPQWSGVFRFARVFAGRSRRSENTLPQMSAHMMRDIGISPDAHWLQDSNLRANRALYGLHG